jgi:hypothetical protein
VNCDRTAKTSLSPLGKILKQPQHCNPSSKASIRERRQRKIFSQQRCIAFSPTDTDTARDFSSRILHDRLAVSQLISAARCLNIQGVKGWPGDIAFAPAAAENLQILQTDMHKVLLNKLSIVTLITWVKTIN